MIMAGSTFRAYVSGQYGPFQGLSAQGAITSSLNAEGILITNWGDNSPSLVSQFLEGDWINRPYQVILDGQLTQDYPDAATLSNTICTEFAQGVGTTPGACAVPIVNGVQIATLPTVAQYAAGQVVGAATDAAKSTINTTVILVLVAVVGLVLVARSGAVHVGV